MNVRVTGSGEPLVLIHGVAGSGAIFAPVISKLSQRYTTVTVDLLGYGFSPKPRLIYSPEEHVEAIRRSVKPHIAGQRAVMVGLSMGSLLAVAYAAAHPEEVSGVIGLGVPYYRSAEEARRDLSRNLWTGLAIRAPRIAPYLVRPLWWTGRRSRLLSQVLAPRMYAGDMARESMMASYQAFASTLDECMIDFRIEPVLHNVAGVPTCFVHGSDDQWCPVERITNLIEGRANCEMRVIEGGGHNLVVLCPAETNEAIVDFVTRRVGR